MWTDDSGYITASTSDTLTNKNLTDASNVFPTFNQNTTGSAASFTGSHTGDDTRTQGATVVGANNGTTHAGLATGILKKTTTTGLPSIAVAADFPTLNQNTTGNAGTVTNGVYTTGSYSNPSWITAVPYSILSGTIPTWNQSTTGNAATATALQTGRTINGVTFDGTGNITVAAAAGTLTRSTLASGVTGIIPHEPGTISRGVWQGTTIDNAYLTNDAPHQERHKHHTDPIFGDDRGPLRRNVDRHGTLHRAFVTLLSLTSRRHVCEPHRLLLRSPAVVTGNAVDRN